MGPSMAEICIKHIGIVVTAYFIVLRLAKEAYTVRQKLFGGVGALLIGILIGCIYDWLPMCSVVLLLLLYYLMMRGVFRPGGKNALTFTLISVGLSYLLYMLSVAFAVFLLFLNKTVIADRFDTPTDAWIYTIRFVTSFRGGLIARSFVFAVQFALSVVILRLKWIHSERGWFLWNDRNDILVFLWTVILSGRELMVTSVLSRTDSGAAIIVCFFLIVMTSFFICFWLKKEYLSSYRIDLEETELQLLEKSLDIKEAQLTRLRTDNERLAELIHKDNKLIPSAVMAVRQALREDDGTGTALASIEELREESCAVLAEYDAHRLRIFQTGDMAVDAALLYMSDRAASFGVAFDADVSVCPDCLSQSALLRRELIAVLAVLCEYAVFSCREIDGSAVSVVVGAEDGSLFVEVSDSGAAFDLYALKKTGKRRHFLLFSKPSREDDELRLIPLFRIIRSNGATLLINRRPEREGITKSVRVTLAGKKEDV